MVTTAQRNALLAITCSWCGAAPSELCSLPVVTRVDGQGGKRRGVRRPVSTLDGGCHDARWQRALGLSAPVLAEVVAEQHKPREGRTAVRLAAGDRPW